MNFAFVTPNYYPATCGVGDHAMRLGSELLRRGHEVVVFSRAPAERHPQAPDIPVVAVPRASPIAIATTIAKELTAGRYSHVVLEYTPQMWGTWRFGSPALPMLAAHAGHSGSSVVLIAHEISTPFVSRPDLAAAASLFWLQLAATIRSCQHVFVTTEGRRGQIRANTSGLVPRPEIEVMRIGPSVLPAPRTPQGSTRRRRIGLFSTLSVGKNFDVAIGAFERIASAHPDIELVLLGDLGPPNSRAFQALKARVDASPHGARIRLPGKLPLELIAQLVASLDVYLFPTDTGANTRSSTLPLALGAGIPVIAAHGVETDPIFVDDESVSFAKDLTGASFADAALRILGDPDLAARLSAGARALYERELDPKRIADRFLATLDATTSTADRRAKSG